MPHVVLIGDRSMTVTVCVQGSLRVESDPEACRMWRTWHGGTREPPDNCFDLLDARARRLTVTVCVQCSLRALLTRKPVPSFEGLSEAHEARAHPYPDTSDYEYRQLIASVWTLDDARWREVERGLREQGERRDVTPEAANLLMVLHDFLIKGRRWRAGAHGANLPPTIPISRPQWWDSAEVPLMFLIKGWRRPAPQGADVPLATADWDAERALAALNITEVPFDTTVGSGQLGYAGGRTIAVSPTGPLQHSTRFHELAHVLLGHTTEGEQNDGALIPLNLRECEAEAVAMRCCAALGLPGVGFTGTYIRHWWGAGKIPRRSAQRILKVVDQILNAGASSPADGEGHS